MLSGPFLPVLFLSKKSTRFKSVCCNKKSPETGDSNRYSLLSELFQAGNKVIHFTQRLQETYISGYRFLTEGLRQQPGYKNIR